MVKICKDCGYKNSNGAKKCKGCGSPFITNKLKNLKKTIKEKI